MDKKEMLSVYMDGEASEFESASVLKQTNNEPTLRQCWENYHLIGDVIRNNLSMAASNRFAERVALAMEHEPVHMAPRKTPYRRVNDTAGFALAASVSAVALVGLLQFGQPAMMNVASHHYETDIQSQYFASAADNGQTDTMDITSVVADTDNQPLAYASFETEGVDTSDSLASGLAVESSVYDYLVNFSQYAVAAPLEGSVPAVNLASYRLD